WGEESSQARKPSDFPQVLYLAVPTNIVSYFLIARECIQPCCPHIRVHSTQTNSCNNNKKKTQSFKPASVKRKEMCCAYRRERLDLLALSETEPSVRLSCPGY
ncbi:mCG144608, partial [Mus musculus]